MESVTDTPGAALSRSRVLSLPTVRIIADRDGLAQLAPAWDALTSTWDSPMQHYIWTRAHADTYSATTELHLVTIGPPHAPVAIAPLVRRLTGRTRLESLGVYELHEPSDLIYSDHRSLLALVTALAELGHALWLPRVPAHSP